MSTVDTPAGTRLSLNDVAREERLESALQELSLLASERPGGVSVDELARHLGFRTRFLHDALEHGRRPAQTPTGSREAVVERVHTDAADYARSRWVLTAEGRQRVQTLIGVG
jgi:hypothetical protein